MARTTIREFQRKFGQFRHQAQHDLIEITQHGRRELVLMSAEQYDWLKAAAQRAHRTEAATEIVITAMERAEMHPEHPLLDGILKQDEA